MDGYRIKTYAKVNLGLDVLRRLPDGYHEVKMVMLGIGIADELVLERAEEGIAVSTDAADLPTDGSNLVYRAARLMLDRYGIPSGVRIHLQKNIPIAAGMAGGSADAAAAMKGINHIYRLGLPLGQLMEDGARIGADVPYCLLGGTALAEGIGERLTPLPPLPFCHILVAKPDASVSTRYVYEHLDVQSLTCHPDIAGMVQALREGSLAGVTGRMGNVLETVTAAVCPAVDRIKRRMLQLGAENSLMSGSGPTVFGIFREEAAAQAAYGQLKEEKLAERVFLTTAV